MLEAYLSSVGGIENLCLSAAYGRFALKMLYQAPKLTLLAPGMYHLYAGHIAIFHQTIDEVMVYEKLAVSTGTELFVISPNCPLLLRKAYQW